MRYLSICSGIEAASVAWRPLGWEPVAFSEIDKFACNVLAHHYPDVPNLDDMEKYREWKIEPGSIDLVVGGTPCQSFSIAGLRKGLDDPRGNLALIFLGIIDRFKPRWVVWENVPGIRSSWADEETFDPSEESKRVLRKIGIDPGWTEEVEQTSDLDCFVSGLAELGYGCFMRSLDAQYFNLAQRRERVFVVGYLGDWRPACAVLLEPESLRGDIAPSREKRQGATHDVAGSLGGGSGARGWNNDLDRSGAYIPEIKCFGGNNTSGPVDVATAVSACKTSAGRQDFESETFVTTGAGFWKEGAGTLRGREQESHEHLVCHALRADGFDASEDGTGRGTPIVPVAFGWNKSQSRSMRINTVVDGLQSSPSSNPAVAFQESQSGCREYSNAGAVRANGPGHDPVGTRLRQGIQVRRLTPTECARLQGFPDDYLSQVTHNGKCPPADGPMYRAFGNSMAVPVMRWIGKRINTIECVPEKRKEGFRGVVTCEARMEQ